MPTVSGSGLCDVRPGDLYWADLRLAFHFNEALGAIVFNDEKSGVSYGPGTAALPTPNHTTKKFGVGACWFGAASSPRGIFIPAGTRPDLAIGTGDFCLFAWVYPTATGVWATMLGDGGTSRIGWASNGRFFIGNGQHLSTTTPAINTNAWNFIEVNRMGGQLRYFCNGAAVGSVVDTTGSPVAFDFNASGTWLGNWSGQTQNLPGYMDDLRLYAGASVAAVAHTAGYTPPTAEFLGQTNGYKGSIVTGSGGVMVPKRGTGLIKAVVPDPYWGTSTSFMSQMENPDGANNVIDGTTGEVIALSSGSVVTSQKRFWNSSVQVIGGTAFRLPTRANLTLDGDYTVEWSFRYSGAPAGQVTFFSSSAVNNQLGINYPSSGRVFAGAGTAISNASVSWVSGSWYDVAVARVGNIYRVWVNGARLGTDVTAILGTFDLSNGFFGSYNTGSMGFTGQLDNLRITKGVARYSANYTVTEFSNSTVVQTIGAVLSGYARLVKRGVAAISVSSTLSGRAWELSRGVGAALGDSLVRGRGYAIHRLVPPKAFTAMAAFNSTVTSVVEVLAPGRDTISGVFSANLDRPQVPVQSIANLGFNILPHTPVQRILALGTSLLGDVPADVAMGQSPYLMHGTTKVELESGDISQDDHSIHWTGTVTLVNPADYDAISKLDQVTLVTPVESFVVLVIAKGRVRSSDEYDMQLRLVSPTILLDDPYSIIPSRKWDATTTAKSIVLDVLGPTPVQWDIIDWGIPAFRYSVSNSSALRVVSDIAAAVGALPFALNDGTLIVESLHPKSLAEYEFANVDKFLSVVDDILSMSEEDAELKRENKLRIMDVVPGNRQDRIVEGDKKGDLQVYPSPWRLHLHLKHTSVGNVNIVSHGELPLQKIDEVVEFFNGEASVGFPINTIESVTWLGVDLLGVSFADYDYKITSSHTTEKFSICRIVYTTRVIGFTASTVVPIVQFLCEDDDA